MMAQPIPTSAVYQMMSDARVSLGLYKTYFHMLSIESVPGTFFPSGGKPIAGKSYRPTFGDALKPQLHKNWKSWLLNSQIYQSKRSNSFWTPIRSNGDFVSTFNENIGPKIFKEVEKNKELASAFSVQPNGSGKYELIDEENRYVVDRIKRECTCRSWQLTGIPCPHAAATIMSERQKVVDYVASWYHKDAYLKTYRCAINLIPGKMFWDECGLPAVYPPDGKRKTDRVMQCQLSMGFGHNIATCKKRKAHGLNEAVTDVPESSNSRRTRSRNESADCEDADIPFSTPSFVNVSGNPPEATATTTTAIASEAAAGNPRRKRKESTAQGTASGATQPQQSSPAATLASESSNANEESPTAPTAPVTRRLLREPADTLGEANGAHANEPEQELQPEMEQKFLFFLALVAGEYEAELESGAEVELRVEVL
ncbi:hypothetical protein Tsubulata_010683 [Turnera subulata]|uniref:SWIM-type domain-containing protein n=1 Tax=Turnera subulata TaxID=218843 RepID=A0A9Q0GF38_9ROSI|nr:hypothetical protein Tsubulata_010683 [Turnera subulata]